MIPRTIVTLRIERLAVAAVLLVCATGCASLNPVAPIPLESKVDSSKGYLYGRLTLMKVRGTNWANNWIVLEDTASKEELMVKFRRENDVVAVEVEPGSYRIIEFRNTKAGPVSTMIKSDVTAIPIGEDLAYIAEPFEVRPNTLHYLGEYASTSVTKSISFGAIVGSAVAYTGNYEMGVGTLVSEYEGTTKDLFEIYPQLRNLPTVELFEHGATHSNSGESDLTIE